MIPLRYGASLRKQVKKMEVSQHARYTCTFCGKVTVKRDCVGIWNCRSCKKVVAGGAWVVSYVSRSGTLDLGILAANDNLLQNTGGCGYEIDHPSSEGDC